MDLNRILTVDSISAAPGSFGGGGFVTALNLESQTGGAASTGGRIALNVLQRQTASTGNFAAGGAYNGVAASFVAIADFNEGGTNFNPGFHTGSLFGINPAVALRNTATYFSELCGGEVNVTAHLGSSVFVKYGWTIVKEAADAVQGAAGLDSALAFSDQLGAQPWDYGILFGNEGGQWAFDANATLMGTRLNTSQGTGGAIGTAKWVMDFLPMTTTGGLLRGTGFVIENTGITRVGFGALKPDPAGMLIDTDGKQAASATIAAGGSNYVSGGYWPDVNGNVWHIDSVGGGGNVTGVTLVKAVVTGTQSTPIALAPSPYVLQATGAVLNVTYVSGTTLSVQPSGGATVFGGPVTLPSGTTGPFLPLSNVGWAIGNVPGPIVNQGGISALHPTAELLFQRAAFAATDGQDFHFRRATAFTGGTSANINKTVLVDTGIGANDTTSNWGLTSKISTASTSASAVGLSAYLQTWRAAGGRSQCWGAVVEMADFTGLKSSLVVGPTSSMEIDLGTTDSDDATNPSTLGGLGNRHLIHFVVTRNQGTLLNEVSHGLWFGTNGSYIDSLIGADLGVGAAGAMVRQIIDARGFIPPTGVTDPVAAVRMSAGQIIDFNGGPALNSAPGLSAISHRDHPPLLRRGRRR